MTLAESIKRQGGSMWRL